jgi:hypothetical protein
MSLRFCTAFALSLVAGFTQIASADLLSASKALLDSLSPEDKATTLKPFDTEERVNWHFIPKKRAGVSFNTLSDEQDKLLLNVISAGLSEEGYEKVQSIRGLEAILKIMEGAEHRDTEDYHILFFGEPSNDGNWTVRYEGHHVSLHWTFVNGKLVSGSPQFLGVNPAEVRIDHPKKGLRVLGQEEDLGRILAMSLNEKQREIGIIGKKVPNDIFTANQSTAERQEDLGIRYGDMDARQKTLLYSIIDLSARVQSDEITKQRKKALEDAGLDDIKFAWLGSLEPGRRHYYRVQGPTFLIEYDNTQNEVNHIHVVWRDFEGDFGRDVLKQHHAHFADPAHPHEHQH